MLASRIVKSTLFLSFLLSSWESAAESSGFFDEGFYSHRTPQTGSKIIGSARELRSETQRILENQLRVDSASRIDLNRKLNQCTPSHDGAALIIAFEGTSAYQPHFPPLMQKVCKQIGPHLSRELKESIHYEVFQTFYSTNLGVEEKWSGLEAGPMNFFCANPEIFPDSYDWYSFPSEETELLADPRNLSWKQLANLPHEIKDSIKKSPAGVRNAVSCTQRYLNAARAQKSPKIIVLSHSSGGRAAIKFLEKLKAIRNPRNGKGIRVDLVFTLDPVREAHEALAEVASQVLANPIKGAFNRVPILPDVEVHPVQIWSRDQREKLYKVSNTNRHINLYQRSDSEGINMRPSFGIHGSPVFKADTNLDMSSKLGSKGHGEITFHPDTLKILESAVRKLYP